MGTLHLDPNRFASGTEAASVHARVALEQDDVDLATRRHEHAQTALKAAEARFFETEALYKLHMAERNDAAAYAAAASDRLDVSLARLVAVRAPLHPVRRTPLEVLGLIFEWCIERAHHTTGFLPVGKTVVRQRQLQPFQLASVCQRWRRAALAAPSLWSVVELRFDSIDLDYIRTWLEYLSLVFSRSAASTLDIRIIRTVNPEETDHELISVVIQEMHRCTSLYVNLRSIDDGDDDVLRILQVETPLLGTLYLRVPVVNEDAGVAKIFPRTPALRCVVAKFPFTLSQPDFSSVSVAVLRSTDAAHLDAFLDAAPNVLELCILHPALSEQIESTTEYGAVKTLRLTCDEDDEDGLSQHACTFYFPNLERLILRGALLGSASRMEYLIVVAHTSKLLTHLDIRHLHSTNLDRLVDALHECTRLHSVEFSNTAFAPEPFGRFCEALEGPDDDSLWLCPALSVVTLSGSCAFRKGCDQSLLARCVEKRQLAAKDAGAQNRPACLTAVHVGRCMNSAVVARINVALAAGN